MCAYSSYRLCHCPSAVLVRFSHHTHRILLTGILRFVPPVIDPYKSNTTNSENTSLFLVSCYQYTLSAIVLSVGKPFRQPMSRNCKFIKNRSICCRALTRLSVPFVVNVVAALFISTYMLLDPADWLYDLMDFTDLSNNFKIFLLALGVGGFACSYAAEMYLFPALAKFVGKTKERLFPSLKKKRKEYKLIMEGMRI